MDAILEVKTNPKVDLIFQNYPKQVKPQLNFLRQLIIATADETKTIHHIEETLKWGEPSFLTRKGSTIRMDWKSTKPDQYALYFSCTSKLVPTFRTVYGTLFKYEKNRAIVFALNDTIPVPQLKQCLQAALSYHTVKKLPNLGMSDI